MKQQDEQHKLARQNKDVKTTKDEKKTSEGMTIASFPHRRYQFNCHPLTGVVLGEISPEAEVPSMEAVPVGLGEQDPLGKAAHEPGSKLDAGKPQIFEYVLGYFPNALKAVAEVSAYGAKKYTSMGWSTVPDGYLRYSEALVRHLTEEAEQYDWKFREKDVSGLEHDMQVAWNALARLELRIRNGTTVAQETKGA